jgi:hypothetical protein
MGWGQYCAKTIANIDVRQEKKYGYKTDFGL